MLALTGCTAFNNSDDGTADGNGTSATTQTFQPSGGKPTATLSIASGSENKEVATAIQKAADQSNVAVTMHYMGSLEIMNALKAGGQDHDAVWPASSMWISMGDTKHIVKDAASTSTTPIVFGIAKSKAVKLGWADDTGATKPVSTADILAAVSDGKLTFSMTSATVIDSALNVYQTALRKPSWTIWVVDYSGSMSGEGKNGVVKGLNAALDPDQAKKSYIEPASGDVNILIPFETEAHRPVKATGTSTSDLLHEADATDASGGTDIYEGLLSALDELPSESEASQYTTAIVLMTDGRSNSDHQDEFESAYKSRGRDLPIFSIMFGDADPSQLKSLATLSNAKVFDGRSGDLAAVFRQVKGFTDAPGNLWIRCRTAARRARLRAGRRRSARPDRGRGAGRTRVYRRLHAHRAGATHRQNAGFRPAQRSEGRRYDRRGERSTQLNRHAHQAST